MKNKTNQRKQDFRKYRLWGDTSRMAKAFGVTNKTIYNIINGEYTNERLEALIDDFIAKRKKDFEARNEKLNQTFENL